MINFVGAALNFALFCACCRVLFKRYKRSVVQEMEQEFTRSVRLVEYRDGLEQQVDEVWAENQRQARACNDLSGKIMLWKKKFDEQQVQERTTHEAMLKKVNETYVQQMHFRQREIYQQQVAAAVIIKARQKLQEEFVSSPSKEQYNNACLRLLEQRKGSL